MLIDALIQTTALLALVAIAAQLLRKQSAALRHLLWTLGIAGLVAAPLLAAATPFRFHLLPARQGVAGVAGVATRGSRELATQARDISGGSDVQDAAPSGSVASPSESGSRDPEPLNVDDSGATSVSWPYITLAVWAAGLLVLLARFVFGLVLVYRISRRSRPVEDAAWSRSAARLARLFGITGTVELRVSDEVAMPFACGLLQPTIVLPASSSDWSSDRREAVLTHEFAHVSRGDLAMNSLSHVVRAFYWFHPLAWLAAHRLRVEGERACDDAVLRAGSRPSEYAEHLLSIVRSVGNVVPGAALAMARASDFEGRLLAILEPAVPRARLTRLRGATIAAVFLLGLMPLTAMTAERATLATSTVLSAQEPGKPAAVARAEQTGQATGAVGALIETLNDASAAVRLAAVQSLGNLGDPRAIAALSKALREDSDARVREAAAHALGEIDDARAVPALIEALKSERAAAVREKIVHALGEIDDPAASGPIGALARDPSVAVRREVAWALGELEDQNAITPLITMTRDEDPDVRKEAAQALGQLKNISSLDALTALVRDANADVRQAAINAIGELEDMRGLPALISGLKDANADVRKQAAESIHQIDGVKKAPPELIALLNDSDRDVRKQAAEALGNIGDEAAVPALKRATTDNDSDVRRQAAEALSDIGGPDAIQALMALLKDQDPEIRRIAAEALGSKRH